MTHTTPPTAPVDRSPIQYFNATTLMQTAHAIDPEALRDEALLAWCLFLEATPNAPLELVERFNVEYQSRGFLS